MSRPLELDPAGRVAAARAIYHTTNPAKLAAVLEQADADIAERIRWLVARNTPRNPRLHAFR